MTTTPTERDREVADRIADAEHCQTFPTGAAILAAYRAEIEAATIARLVEQAGVTGEELAKRVNHDESGAYLADDAAILNQALAAAVAKGAADERAAVVKYLRDQANVAADYGLASEKGTTKRASYGGGSLACDRAADAITAGAHHE